MTPLISNPFTPTEIAAQPEDFFGRHSELRLTERSLAQGSVIIQGPVGIGKSSLLARVRLLMEGFDSTYKSKSIIAVVDKEVETVDQAAQLILEQFVEVDEVQDKIKFNLGKIIEIESSEVCSYFKAGRHLAALKRVVENEYLRRVITDQDYLLLCIDEADKSPISLTRVIRSLTTHIQQNGIKNVRFLVAGVTPFFQEMTKEDPGIQRFFYKTITLAPMPDNEATELLETKLNRVVGDAERQGLALGVDLAVIEQIVRLSGGHPHLLQLLGSHLIEHEIRVGDGLIDSRDLISALRTICYEDRGRHYDTIIHSLDLDGLLDSLRSLLEIATAVPTRIDRQDAEEVVGKETLKQLVENNVLVVSASGEYGLIDEFLRVRLTMDGADGESQTSAIERRFISLASMETDEGLAGFTAGLSDADHETYLTDNSEFLDSREIDDDDSDNEPTTDRTDRDEMEALSTHEKALSWHLEKRCLPGIAIILQELDNWLRTNLLCECGWSDTHLLYRISRGAGEPVLGATNWLTVLTNPKTLILEFRVQTNTFDIEALRDQLDLRPLSFPHLAKEEPEVVRHDSPKSEPRVFFSRVGLMRENVYTDVVRFRLDEDFDLSPRFFDFVRQAYSAYSDES